jgi:hypothetical protein
MLHCNWGRAIAQVVSRWLPSWRPEFAPGSGQVGFVVDKVRWGGFSPSTSVSSANLNSIKFFILPVTRGR